MLIKKIILITLETYHKNVNVSNQIISKILKTFV
jgi:hypothetical protein